MPAGTSLFPLVSAVECGVDEKDERGHRDEEDQQSEKNSKKILEGHLADHFGMITRSFMRGELSSQGVELVAEVIAKSSVQTRWETFLHFAGRCGLIGAPTTKGLTCRTFD